MSRLPLPALTVLISLLAAALLCPRPCPAQAASPVPASPAAPPAPHSPADWMAQGHAAEAAKDYVQAAKDYDKALTLAPHSVRTLTALAHAEQMAGRFADAVALLEADLPAMTKPEGRKALQLAEADVQFAWAQSLLQNQPADALPHYQAALVIDQTQRPLQAALDMRRMGIAYYYLSQYAKAIDCYQQALPIFQKAGDRDGEASDLMNLGIAYNGLSQYAKAIDFFQQALAMDRQTGDKDGEAKDLTSLGAAYRSLSQYAKAIDFYRQALPLFQKAGDRDAEARDLGNLGNAYSHLSQYAKAIDFYQQALPLFQKVGDRDGEASNLMNLGSAYRSLSQYAKAIDFYQQALPLYQKAGDRDGEAKDLNNLMALHGQQKSPRLAIYYGKQAVNVYQSVRADQQTLDKQTQKTYLASVSDTYRRLADLLIGEGRLPEAEQVLRMLKDQELTDFVQRDASVVPAEIAVSFDPEEQAALDGYQKFADPVTKIGQEVAALQAKKSLADTEKQQLVAWQDQLGPAQRAFHAYLTNQLPQEMADRKPAPGQDDPAQAVRDAQKQQAQLLAMGPGTVALYTIVEPDKYRVIVVTAKAEKAEEYPIKAEDLRRLVFAWRDALRHPDVDPRPLGQKLSHILIGPIEKDLNGAQAKTLLWSLDDALRYVPLAALYDGQHYLAEKYRTAIFTGASLPAVPAQPVDWQGSANALLPLGVTQAHTVPDPAGGKPLTFPSLPGVDQEMKDIARYEGNPGGALAGKPLEDGQFTQAALRLGLAGSPTVVHIASHFELGGNYKASFLLLGDGTPLTLEALCGQGGGIFQGVDLLTLSACQTGEGVRTGDGHEFESLGSLAQEQGASSILASLWPVSDATTPLLMRAFYRQRASGTDMSKAEALRQAQLSLLRGTLAVPPMPTRGTAMVGGQARSPEAPEFTPSDSAPCAHPYYWASFVLIGNWR